MALRGNAIDILSRIFGEKIEGIWEFLNGLKLGGNLDMQNNDILNVKDLATATITSADGTTIKLILGTDSGNDFFAGNNNALVVKGDTDRTGFGTNDPKQRVDIFDNMQFGIGDRGETVMYVNNNNENPSRPTGQVWFKPSINNISLETWVIPKGSGGVPSMGVNDSPTRASGSHNFFVGTGGSTVAINTWNFSSTILGDATANSWPIGFNVSSIARGRFQALEINNLGDVEVIVGNINLAKSRLTTSGGYAIKLTNKTGAVTIAGQLVKADTATNDAVILAAAGDIECFGVFLDAGVANNSEAWVVVSGIADVALDDNVAAVRGNWMGTGVLAGYAATGASPPAAPTHFEEIGHCIESVSAGGGGTHVLARCVLHFN